MHNRKLRAGNRFYVIYRKIRFLSKRGSLFTSSKKDNSGRIRIPGRDFNVISFNSLLLFLTAYFIIYCLNLFVTGYSAIIFNIPVVVYYHDVDYLIRGIDWTPDSVSGVFSSGPIAMFVLTLFMLILYKTVETEKGILKLLLIWMIFHAFTRVFGEILIGAILNKGFGFVILYLFLMDTGKVILTIFGFVAMFSIGLILTRPALYTANIYFNDLHSSYRSKFIFRQFILPFIIGNILIFLIKLPQYNYFDIGVNASMVLILIPVMVRGLGMADFYFDEDPRMVRRNYTLLLATMLFVILFRVVLGIGVRL
jgi:hypothetical protein